MEVDGESAAGESSGALEKMDDLDLVVCPLEPFTCASRIEICFAAANFTFRCYWMKNLLMLRG
jgi:hypothetical protein